MRTLAVLDSATLPAEQRTRAELFYLYHLSYIKQPLDTPDIIGTLRERGLAIASEEKAIAF